MKFSGKSQKRAEGVTLSGKKDRERRGLRRIPLGAEGVNLSGKRTERTRFFAFVFSYSLELPMHMHGGSFFAKMSENKIRTNSF